MTQISVYIFLNLAGFSYAKRGWLKSFIRPARINVGILIYI
jgi:hypothetical protein